MSLTLKQLEELEELEKSATPSGWYTEFDQVRFDFDPYATNMGHDCTIAICTVGMISERLDHFGPNRELIAKSRNALPELLKMARELLEMKTANESACG